MGKPRYGDMDGQKHSQGRCIMLGGVTSASYKLTQIYNSNSQQLANSLARIASGKKYVNAGDDFASFARGQTIESDIIGYEHVQVNLKLAEGITDAGVEIGGQLYEDLIEMRELAELYEAEEAGANDADVLAGYESEFDALKEKVVSAIGNTSVDGTDIVQAANLSTVSLDPAGTGTLAITPTTVPDSAAIDAFDLSGATTSGDVDTQVGNALTYLTEMQGFDKSIESQINITDTIIASKEAAKSLVTEIDEAEELSRVTALNVRQQSTIAMIAQANMSHAAVARLYGGQ
ncbi:MAG: hypothetical protein GF350_04145 [Chitinivibrionales bacterium]|nr:hypothetical protein [Chitinivibrionales bacterium]